MYKSIAPGALGIRGKSLVESAELARQAGFEGLDFDIKAADDLAHAQGIDRVRAIFADNEIRPGCWGLPFDWRADDWRDGVAELERQAEVAAELGAFRCATWCPPSSAEREFEDNFAWHVERFRAIAAALKTAGVRFGIEFIGPQSMRPAHQHDFIHTMDGMLELAAAIGTGNVGLLLDAWHLHTSGGALDDLDRISADDVVHVHVNDAPPGLTMAEYDDHDRRLPMETSVLPLEGFMHKLMALGYAGPVTPEPFSKRVNTIEDPLEAAQLTARHMERLWKVAGLG